MSGTRRVANDPLRKQRILDGALQVIAAEGVHRLTHRRIAAAAGVPLGSLTYHFASLTAITEQAFALLVTRMSEQYRATLTAAGDPVAAVTDLICDPAYAGPRELALIHELYSYATHNPAVADLMRDWMRRSRASLAAQFSAPAARAVDALIEGWTIHRTFEGAPLDRAMVLATVTAIADRFPLAPETGSDADVRSGTTTACEPSESPSGAPSTA